MEPHERRPQQAPEQARETGALGRYRAEDDVGETVAYCDTCREERRWVKDTEDVSAREAASDSPSITHAMGGVTGYRCTVCGTFKRDLVAEGGYDFEDSDVGLDVPNFPDDERTVHAQEGTEEGMVTPAERVPFPEPARAMERQGSAPAEAERPPEEGDVGNTVRKGTDPPGPRHEPQRDTDR